jgi:pyrroline-5-carboxylate reductase
MKKFGFIGYGNMGKSLVLGLYNVGYPKEAIYIYDKDTQKTEGINFKVVSNVKDIIKYSDYIWLCVKPDNRKEVFADIKDTIKTEDIDLEKKVIVSIMAGISIKDIEEGIGSSLKVIRIMPNTPALIGEGAFGISYNAHISDDDVELIRVLLNKLGRSFLLKEDLIDAVTALSGSGPAYVYLFIMALVDAGVKMGLSRDIAEGLVKQTIAGSIKFMEESSFNPYDLISYITSPGGTTIHALHTLHKSGFYSAVIDGVYSAYVRAKELSEEEIKK